MQRLRRVTAIAATLAAAVSMLGAGVVPAAATRPQPAIVSADPSDLTPHVLDGSVRAIVESGDTIIAGGTFTQVRNTNSSAIIAQRKLFALDRRTGRVITGFAPVVDGDVWTLAVSEDGESVFVGGSFSTVNGVTTRRLAKLRISDGSLVAGFKAPAMDGVVSDMKITSRALYLGGSWRKIAGAARPALAAVDPDTGRVDPSLAIVLSDPARGGVTQVISLDLTPDGRRMAVLGNFTRAGGLARNQIVMLDLGATGTQATVANWATDRYAADCSTRYQMYVRELDISPDGSYFVVVTTGAYRKGLLCDTAARWETGASGTALQPTWVNYTGGDTLYSATVTGTAVYVGGHQRWLNNAHASDAAGPGAVARSGIAALDPRNGLPFSWNPGRTRGVGVFDILATREGIWAGSDTEDFGGEFHGRIAFFPLAGGRSVPPAYAQSLPGTVVVLGSDGTLTHRTCTAELSCTSAAADPGGVPWGYARGAFMLSGMLYYGASDGTLRKRSYDGSSFGVESRIDLRGLTGPANSSTDFASELKSVTGAYVVAGRLYYTVAGRSKLYYRWFTAESDVLGSERYEASTADQPGLKWGDIRSAFRSGSTLYAATMSGLFSIPLTSTGSPTGSWSRVSSPFSWLARGAAVLSVDGYDPAPASAPTPVIAGASCVDLTCSFDATGSLDPDGGQVQARWDFGDGTAGSGLTAGRSYASAGTYTVTLTVTDDEGAQASASVDVAPAPQPSDSTIQRTT